MYTEINLPFNYLQDSLVIYLAYKTLFSLSFLDLSLFLLGREKPWQPLLAPTEDSHTESNKHKEIIWKSERCIVERTSGEFYAVQ